MGGSKRPGSSEDAGASGAVRRVLACLGGRFKIDDAFLLRWLVGVVRRMMTRRCSRRIQSWKIDARLRRPRQGVVCGGGGLIV